MRINDKILAIVLKRCYNNSLKGGEITEHLFAVFDMDGVLVDSEATFKRSCADALHEWNVFPEHEEFTPYTGMGDVLYIGEVAKAHGVPFTPAMQERAYALYGEYAKETLTVFPWSREVLMSLHDNGIEMCVASSAGLFKVETNLRCVGVELDIFKTIISGDEVEKKKPAPDIFLKAAEKSDIAPSRCLVFEDAVSGVMAAKAAGMNCAAVTTSFSREKLLSAGADFVCNDLKDAVTLFFDIKF